MARRTGKLNVRSYIKINGKWFLSETRVEEDSILDVEHWQKWKITDSNFGSKSVVEATNGVLDRYTTYSPDAKSKVVYERVKK